jgi:hypothetical protein
MPEPEVLDAQTLDFAIRSEAQRPAAHTEIGTETSVGETWGATDIQPELHSASQEQTPSGLVAAPDVTRRTQTPYENPDENEPVASGLRDRDEAAPRVECRTQALDPFPATISTDQWVAEPSEPGCPESKDESSWAAEQTSGATRITSPMPEPEVPGEQALDFAISSEVPRPMEHAGENSATSASETWEAADSQPDSESASQEGTLSDATGRPQTSSECRGEIESLAAGFRDHSGDAPTQVERPGQPLESQPGPAAIPTNQPSAESSETGSPESEDETFRAIEQAPGTTRITSPEIPSEQTSDFAIPSEAQRLAEHTTENSATSASEACEAADSRPEPESASREQTLPRRTEAHDATEHPQKPSENRDESEPVAAAASSLSREASGIADEEGGDRTVRRRERAKNPVPDSQIERTVLRRMLPRVSARFKLPDSYQQWNRAIIEYCLLAKHPGESRLAYLSITPRVLSSTFEAEYGVLLMPEDAATQFTEAVSLAYRTEVLNEPEKLWALAEPADDSMPTSVALLALSVLAAYEMHADEDAGPNAYYPRLASLLGIDLIAGHPRGFDLRDFEGLWLLLNSWLETRTGRRLALPGPNAGLRRFLAYPLCHVPLRKIDIEKLPEFFDWAGLEPGSKAEPAVLGDALRRWASGRDVLSKAGETSLTDERRPAVEAQVAMELEAWDGSWTDRLGRRTAAVHILLDFVRRRPHLYFLPRRPLSFPEVFDDGSHRFQGAEQGWYEPVEIAPEDGPVLQTGFLWNSSSSRGSFSLHRPSTTVLALSPDSDFTGFLSQRGLPLGIQSAVLCAEQLERTVQEFLISITGTRCRPLDDPDIPRGWRLFAGVVPRQAPPPPAGLDVLSVESGATVILRGGLRMGRRAAWLEGAPPTILIGGGDDLVASFDGEAARITDGVLQVPGPLRVGAHVVEVGGARRRFETVEPQGEWDECTPLVPAHTPVGLAPVTLPPGRWAVIGAAPDDVAFVGPADDGLLVSPPFPPIWAVSVGTRRGATVLSVTDDPPAPRSSGRGYAQPRGSALVWATAIYDAHIRRPRFGWLDGAGSDIELRVTWRRYFATAKALKRRRRRLP